MYIFSDEYSYISPPKKIEGRFLDDVVVPFSLDACKR